MNRELIIRADADTQIGAGHLMRCLALAQGWQANDGEVAFITACNNKGLLERLHEEGFSVHLMEKVYPDPHDWEVTKGILQQHPGAWIVLDGYHFDKVYHQQVKEAGHPLLVIDDMAHLEHYYADIVLNQNIHAEQLHYSCEPYTHLLLGTRYALLRREFLKWRGWKQEIPDVARKVLVTLGGGDPDNITLKVINAINTLSVKDLEVKVVVGSANPHMASLQEAIDPSPFTLHLLPAVKNMPELMVWADVAVAAGGSTCWELAFMGVPNLVLIIANNQRGIAERLDAVRAAVNLGCYESLGSVRIAEELTRLLVQADRRTEMAQHGQKLVDGEGADRILLHIKGEKLRLRLAREKDCKLLWEWANDPEVRVVSFLSDPIPWDQHVHWFQTKVNDFNCIFYIAMDRYSLPIGQARYDIRGSESTISVSLDQKFRGKGYGSELIWLSSRKLFNTQNINTIHAYIKKGNEVSIRAFAKAGFKSMGTAIVHEHQAIHMALRKDEMIL